MNKKDSENTEIAASAEKAIVPLTPTQEELKGVKWGEWHFNEGNVPCPTADDDLVHIKQRNGDQNIGIAKNLGNWEFDTKVDSFPGDITAYRHGYRKVQKVRGPLEAADKSHDLRTGDEVLVKDRKKVISGVIHGWVEGSESDKPYRYLVKLSGEEKLKEVEPDMVEMDGLRWNQDED